METFSLDSGPTRGGFRGYIVPGPGPRGPQTQGARQSSGYRVKFRCRTQRRICETKFE